MCAAHECVIVQQLNRQEGVVLGICQSYDFSESLSPKFSPQEIVGYSACCSSFLYAVNCKGRNVAGELLALLTAVTKTAVSPNRKKPRHFRQRSVHISPIEMPVFSCQNQ
jgi:hypothetical protein